MGQVEANNTLPRSQSRTTAFQTSEPEPELTFVSGIMECSETASYIRSAVYAEFSPKTLWEDLLVEELAQMTIRLREFEQQRDRVLRAHAFQFVHQDILQLQNLGRLRDISDDLRALVDDWAFGSHQAHARAAKRLATLGVSIDGAVTRAVAACVDDLDTIDRASSRARRQRDRHQADYQAQRIARARAEVTDAEVVEE